MRDDEILHIQQQQHYPDECRFALRLPIRRRYRSRGCSQLDWLITQTRGSMQGWTSSRGVAGTIPIWCSIAPTTRWLFSDVVAGYRRANPLIKETRSHWRQTMHPIMYCLHVPLTHHVKDRPYTDERERGRVTQSCNVPHALNEYRSGSKHRTKQIDLLNTTWF